nr:hypothetical protein [uncultured Desulfobacter sp.]
MNKDIRLALGFLDHPKTIKLKRKLGFDGIESLLRLWFFAAQYKPDGNLIDLNEDDIEIAAKWNGAPGVFVDALVALRWLDAPCNATSNANAFFVLHAWEENNGYVAHAKARSDKAKMAAKARWDSKSIKKKHAIGDAETPVNNGPHATSNARSNAECNAPNPNPNPNPNPIVNTPPTPSRGRVSKKKEFENYLIEKIQGTSFVKYQDVLIEFIGYRMSLPASKNYNTTHGIDGLLACVGDLLRVGLDPDVCLTQAMGEEWLKPKPEYFLKGSTKGGKSDRSDQNAMACQEFINDMMQECENE